jgi:hypothetical protein
MFNGLSRISVTQAQANATKPPPMGGPVVPPPKRNKMHKCTSEGCGAELFPKDKDRIDLEKMHPTFVYLRRHLIFKTDIVISVNAQDTDAIRIEFF